MSQIIQARQRYIRISPFKLREITRAIQGNLAEKMLQFLAITPKKGARILHKVLKSAIANAEHNCNIRAAQLLIKEAVVGEGPTIKRMAIRARGSSDRILKRTSHVTIKLVTEPIKSIQSSKNK